MKESLGRSLLKSCFGLFTCAAVVLPGTALADERGEITIVGRGQATAAPEMTRLKVEVTSICYETSREAKDANAKLANQVLEVLKKFQVADQGKLVATGGANVLRTETVYVGTEARVLCELKWRSTNTLILESPTLDQMPDLQDQILAVVDSRAINPQLAAQTFAEMDQPVFFLKTDTMNRLKKEAHTAAYDDGRLQFDAFNARCNFKDPTLSKILPPEYNVYGRRGGDAIPADGADSTPIIPDDIAVDAAWTFVWTFIPGGGCTP
jgi:hypothetical protein